MHYLSVVAIVLTLFNLLLTFGLIRKLRELTSERTGAVSVPVGKRVDAFNARTVNGGIVSRDGITTAHLVGFFTPGCAPCEEQIPEFLRHIQRTGLNGLAVVVASDDAEARGYAERLSAAGDAVIEPSGGPVSTAFKVTSFPTLCLIDPGATVLASGNDFSELPDLVAA